MTRLEDLRPTAAVRGILPDAQVAVVTTQCFGSDALELTYKNPAGRLGNVLLYRHDEPRRRDPTHRSWLLPACSAGILGNRARLMGRLLLLPNLEGSHRPSGDRPRADEDLVERLR